jgi:hypothetical protein
MVPRVTKVVVRVEPQPEHFRHPVVKFLTFMLVAKPDGTAVVHQEPPVVVMVVAHLTFVRRATH